MKGRLWRILWKTCSKLRCLSSTTGGVVAETNVVAIAANAGFYTFPNTGVEFPYGLRNSVIGDSELKAAFGKKLIILLGENDNDPNDRELKKSEEAMAQGAHRLERGTNYYLSAQNRAKELGVELKWERIVVKNVGH